MEMNDLIVHCSFPRGKKLEAKRQDPVTHVKKKKEKTEILMCECVSV